MRRPFSFTVGALLCFSLSAFSQPLSWQPVTRGFGNLPLTLQLYKTTDSLDGHPFIGYCLVADLNDHSLEFTTQTGENNACSAADYYKREKDPLVIINGGLFSPETHRNLNLVMKNGKLIAYNLPALKSRFSDSFYYPTRAAIGITRHRQPDVAWTFTDTAMRWPYAFEYDPVIAKGDTAVPAFKDLHTIAQWKRWHMWTAIGGGPMLVQKGQVRITNREEQAFIDSGNDRDARTAMGYTRDGKLIVLAIQGFLPGVSEGATLLEEAQIMIRLGCVEALNLNSGAHSFMFLNGKPSTIVPNGEEQTAGSIFVIRWKR